MTEIVQQTFELEEVKAEVNVGTITSNIKDIFNQAVAIKEHYESLIITEDQLDVAKKEKANVNKAKDAVATYRKKIVAEYKKPIEEFEKTAKEAEKVLAETYDCINESVKKYEDVTRKQKEDEVRAYFTEYAESLNLDFVAYEKANINVTLTASVKSLKQAAKTFLDNIINDLHLIDTQEDKIEILAEYKQTLNVSGAIMNVKARKEAEARERERQEILAKAKLEKEAQMQKVDQAVAEVTAPAEIPEPVVEEEYSMNFTVYGTLDQLRSVKHFLEERGIRYDTAKSAS